MNRRAARWLAPIRLLFAVMSITIVFASPGGVHAGPSAQSLSAQSQSQSQAAPTTVPDPDTPTITANEFLPEDRDLSDCVGALEKPGCGSEQRGGAMLNLVFVLVIGGMAFIFWRVIVGVRKNRAELDEPDAASPDPAKPDPTQPDPTQPGPTKPASTES